MRDLHVLGVQLGGVVKGDVDDDDRRIVFERVIVSAGALGAGLPHTFHDFVRGSLRIQWEVLDLILLKFRLFIALPRHHTSSPAHASAARLMLPSLFIYLFIYHGEKNVPWR